MALFCLRLNRSSCFYPLSAHLTSCFQVYKQGGHAWKTRPFLSSAQLSTKNRFQRATNTAILPLRTAIFARTFLPRDKTTFLQAWRQAKGVAVRTLWGHHIHTSRPLRALPAPLIWLLLKPLQKLLAVILGRSIRKWWVALPPNRRQLAREAAWRSRWVLTAAAAIIMVIAALFLLTHLDESPLTGRTRLLVFSRENYMELAAVMTEDYLEKFAEQLVPGDDPSHRLVEQVVQHLADRNKDVPEVSSIPWSVHVVKDPAVNAFVLPAEQASLSHVVDLLSLILLTAIWALCPRDSLAVFGHWIQGKLIQLMFSRPYSRKLEAEADKVGMQLAAKACADVRAAPVFWQQMEITDQLRAVPAVPEWLSTHPSHRNRVTQMDRFVPQALELRDCCECPALPSADPRVVFSKSVRTLLDKAKVKGRGSQSSNSPPQPQ
ncbi:metalloendopeptidase OMA1, mitochondrial isoform X2 [Gadus macrocephalus]|uniref:metalloendopeptidase OMA1, mitochondrial isoform X2 n=1 Tax=Gadus macrocephalus TaxID=80720 RepID=UPI0028CB969C|nr:metalloendopeptidase OMA1, mitochondrial isoform X2 [Gadus macrocephalus]